MNEKLRIVQASVIEASAYQQSLRNGEQASGARSEASRILAEARAEAELIVAAAEQRAQQTEMHLQQISDETLMRFVNTDAVEETALAVQKLLEEASKVRADFDAFAPWMTAFVKATVARITDQIAPDDLWDGVVSQALVDIRDRWNIVLRCHPSRESLFRAMKNRETGALAELINDLEVDRNLRCDECHLVTSKGVVDISVSTQVASVLRALDQMSNAAGDTTARQVH